MPDLAGYKVRSAASEDDFAGILALQARNLSASIGPVERGTEGFVTLRHDLQVLRTMNEPHPHVVATTVQCDDVIAYALVMLIEHRHLISELDPMFDRREVLARPGGPIADLRYYIMGQVCVEKDHRGRGLVQAMYDAHQAQMSPHFDLMITEIDQANPRSIRAHERAGFATIDEYAGGFGKRWSIDALDLRPPESRSCEELTP